MPLDFPNNPTVGQVYTGPNNVVWQWDNSKWVAGYGAATAYAPIASPAFTGDPTAPTPAAGDADASLATTAFVAAAVAPDRNNVGRNLVHNPLFNIQQRGSGPFSANGYTLDRWNLIRSGDTTTAQSFPLSDGNRAQIGDEAAQFCLFFSINGTAGAGNFSQIVHPIENIYRLAGKTVTVSFWAASGTSSSVGVRLWQDPGIGGSPSAGFNTPPQTVAVSSVPVRYSRTFTLPSVSGKTMGTSGTHRTELILALSSGSTNSPTLGVGVQTGDIWFWGVQLEVGTVATPLEKPDPRVDLANCQRFYETSYNGVPGSFALNTGEGFGMAHPAASYRGYVTFKVKKRANPTVTVWDSAGGQGTCSYYDGTWRSGGALFLASATQAGMYTGSGIASAIETQFGWAASADL